MLRAVASLSGSAAAAAVLAACGQTAAPAPTSAPAAAASTAAPAAPATGTMGDWSAPADAARAKEQAADFQTYGMPDDWANYGEMFKAFGEKNGFTVGRKDTDMSSLEEITKFDAEKNNPVAVMADIGMLYGIVADQRGVVPPYLPEAARAFPEGFTSKNGGWFATFVGVPSFVVNTDVVKNVPQTWADLAKPEYKGLVNAMDPTRSGTDATTLLAWAYSLGGNEGDLSVVTDFAKQMVGQYTTASANAQTLEKGEVPIQIKYDFNCIAAAEAVKAKGVNATVVVPGVSIYAPSALMLNTYNTAKMDLAKMFSEFILTDEGQAVFARFGARPIRTVVGDLKVPDEAKAKWLPDDNYAKVVNVQNWGTVEVEKIAAFWTDEVLGG
jgi:putative spermidine/putrescine transport system substrate-binding protein